MKTGALLGVIWAVGFATPFFAAEKPAEACGGAIRSVVDNHVMLVASAEKALSEGQFTKAASDVSNAFPGLKKFPIGTGPLADRSLRILALAVSRADGSLTAGAMKASDKETNLEWAVTTLRGLNAKRPNNPSLQTDLGEALAKIEKHRDEANKLLGGLADKDLLASAEGYAALAKMKQTSGDSPGRDAAVKRCQGMTKTPKVCQIGGGSAAS